MTTKLYYHFLPEVGSSVKRRADDIVSLINRRDELLKKLKSLQEEIKEEEKDLLADVKRDWREDEIQEAKDRYQEFIN